MELKYQPMNESKSNLWEVFIEYEHGDADHSHSEIHLYPRATEDEIKDLLSRINKASELIERIRSYGESNLATEVYNLTNTGKLGFEVMSDKVYLNASDYFAQLNLGDVFYYDNSGAKFKVVIKE